MYLRLISILAFVTMSLLPPECLARVTDKHSLEEAIKNGCVTLEWSCSYVVSGTKVAEQGTAYLQGNCFRVESETLANISDGISLWLVDKAAKEVVVEKSFGGDMISSIMRDAKLIFDNSGNLSSGEYVTREGIRISLKFSALKELPRLQEQFFSGSDFSGKDWIVTEAD